MRMQSPTVSDEMPKRFRINESARHRATRTFLMKCEEAVCRFSCKTLQINALAVCHVMVMQRPRRPFFHKLNDVNVRNQYR